jgi:predicted acetyltransferase
LYVLLFKQKSFKDNGAIMREVRILDKPQLREALSIAAKAYPMMGVSTEQQLIDFETRIAEDFEQKSRTWYGLFEDGKLLGNMVLYDFTMNYYGKDVKACGIGFVAVDFLHKKQKVAFEMLHWYLEDSIQKNYPLALLYSFRPDFYKKMGFGYGTTCLNYVTTPAAFPKSATPYPIEPITVDNKDEVIALYNTLYKSQHGMIPRRDKDVEQMLKAPCVYRTGFRENGQLTALLTFKLKADESTNQSTHMNLDLLYTTPTGLKAAMNFLHSQSDQVSEITISTLNRDFYYNLQDIRHNDHRILKDPGFHHIFDAGMGMMARSLNPIKLVLSRPCTLDNYRIRFSLKDDFVADTARDFIIEWKAGIAKQVKGKKADLELSMDVSDFSSWILNAIDLTTLYQYGLVAISDPTQLAIIDRAFYYQQKPVCLERF